jgi:acyl-[acyl carrier protein]--UDP-N-acetylglucosamine O-acyltransferase
MVIGANTMIGMNGIVIRHVPPFATLVNRRFTKVNRRGLERLGWSEATLTTIEAFYRDGARWASQADDIWTEPIRSFFERIGDAKFEHFAAR